MYLLHLQRWRLTSCDENKIVTLLCFLFQDRIKKAECFSDYPPCPIPFNRISNLFARHDTKAVSTATAWSHITDEPVGHYRFTLLEQKIEITVAFDDNIPFLQIRHRLSHPKLVAELFSALCTAASENLTAVLCSHSLHKAMLLLSLALLRLICSFHFLKPPFGL